MSRRGVALALLGALVLIVGILLVARWLRPSPPETTVVARGSIDVTIQTVGVIQPLSTTSIDAKSAGVVKQVAVRVGDRVSAGDIVVMLDPDSFNRQVTAAQDQLESAEFSLQLAERQLAANPDDDSARAGVLAADADVAGAQAALDDARAALADAAITAPSDGVVSQVIAKDGAAVAANQPVVTILDPLSLELVADVDELDLPNVQPGAAVTFRLDSYPANEIDGSIEYTEPVAHQQGGSTIFSAHVSFSPPTDIDIRPGMNADVTIVTASRDGVLLVPERALRTVGERTFVTVRTDGHDEEREIHLGYRGNGQVEVVDGLSEGDRVILR